MKKIAFLIPTLSNGGAEKVMSILTRHLPSEYDKYIIVYNDKKLTYSFQGKILSLNLYKKNINKIFAKLVKIITFPILVKKIKKIKKKYEFDVVISFLNHFNLINLITKQDEKVIISIRNYITLQHANFTGKLLTSLIKHNIEKADRIIAVSKMIAEDIKKNFSIDSSRINIIYNPYEINLISEMAIEEITVNNQSLENKRIIVTVGSYHNKKGHVNLLNIFVNLVKKYDDLLLIIVGDGTLRKDYEEYIKKYSVQDKVILTGFVENPFKYIKKSTIFVLPSRHEGFPNVLVEAMICSKPIISTDCFTGPSEILAPDKDWSKTIKDIYKTNYGFLVPLMDWNNNPNILNDNEKKFMVALEILLNDEKLRNEFGNNAKNRASDFNVGYIVKKWNKTIEDIIGV